MECTLVRLTLLTSQSAALLITAMQTTFSDATITGYEPLITQMTTDVKDHYVTAATASIGADIVTFNLRHFRAADLALFGIVALQPDTFLLELLVASPTVLNDIMQKLIATRQTTARTTDQFLSRLEDLTPAFAAAVRARLAP